MEIPVRRLKALFGLVAAVVPALILAGCYTIFTHPGKAKSGEEYTYRQKGCYDCHDEASFYHSFYGAYFDYYSAPWFGYYSDPWWYDAYWYGDPEPGVVRESRGRRQWSRGSPPGSPRGARGYAPARPFLKEEYIRGSQGSGGGTKADKPENKGKKEEKPKKKRQHYRRGKGK